MLIGVGAILPGVSGGMIAAAFNIYSVDEFDKVTKTPIRAVLSIWEYILGILLGVLGFLVIAYVFYLIPIPSTLLFIGLILGGIPEIYKLAEEKTRKFKPIIMFSLTFILMISFTISAPYLTQTDTSNKLYTLDCCWYTISS